MNWSQIPQTLKDWSLSAALEKSSKHLFPNVSVGGAYSQLVRVRVLTGRKLQATYSSGPDLVDIQGHLKLADSLQVELVLVQVQFPHPILKQSELAMSCLCFVPKDYVSIKATENWISLLIDCFLIDEELLLFERQQLGVTGKKSDTTSRWRGFRHTVCQQWEGGEKNETAVDVTR